MRCFHWSLFRSFDRHGIGRNFPLTILDGRIVPFPKSTRRERKSSCGYYSPLTILVGNIVPFPRSRKQRKSFYGNYYSRYLSEEIHGLSSRICRTHIHTYLQYIVNRREQKRRRKETNKKKKTINDSATMCNTNYDKQETNNPNSGCFAVVIEKNSNVRTIPHQ